jgi:hypothetical protein
MSNNYLLLKVSVLEHVSSNEACRIAEDILTVICNPPGQAVLPSPTPTVTASPTPLPSFASSLTIPGLASNNGSISGSGITFSSSGGSIFSFDPQADSATMSTLSIRSGTINSSTEIARIIFLDGYLNKGFKLRINSRDYYGSFINGTLYFQ